MRAARKSAEEQYQLVLECRRSGPRYKYAPFPANGSAKASIAEWQRQIESWNADRLKTDQFIQLVKCYTDFSELTTPMLNEFIEKVVVHEGEGRGNDRRRAYAGGNGTACGIPP